MAKIFISYARSTAERARLIADTLTAGGHEVWIDDQLLAHRSFTDTIEEQLTSADAVIVVWSADAARSEWVRAEANRARIAGKLVQVRLDSCALPLPYDEIHCIDISAWSGDFQVPQWRSVLASIAAVTGHQRGLAPIEPERSPRSRGANASKEPRRAERRQVTALYCDLMDAGSLAASLDPEDMMQVLDVYQSACDDIIAQHGGAVAKYMGHGLLAYFGYPRGDEEEAANAVRAGLTLCERVGGLEFPANVALRLRVGVATGLVVISELIGRNEIREAGVVGETPNLATQLESVAPPNGVIVSEATRRITEGLFTYRDLGSVALAGYERGVRAFEAADATQVSSRSQARTHNPATPLFGRGSELAQMLESWTLTCEGEGQVVLLQGEGGIGKSSLVDAFRGRAAETPSVQTTWYCGPNHSQTALHPICEQFSRAAGFERGDGADLRRDKLFNLLSSYGVADPQVHAVLADLLGIAMEASDLTGGLTPERRKAMTLDTLLSIMDVWASEKPALFVFEDLHWADPTTLEFLDRATRRAVDHPWLILATARPEFEARWADHADIRDIQLGRLGRADSARLCASLGAEAILPADVVRQIIERADGIPLFVEEITKSVLEAAAASGPDSVARVSIPSTLQDSLAARLDRLGRAKDVACLGAAIGRRFGYELLAAIAPYPAAELRQALRELTKSGLVERSGVPPNSHYMFKHALIRDAAYEALLKRERETLHGRIATALRDLFPETRQADPAILAYHLTESGALAEAIPLWAEAGQQAASRASHAEAVSRLQTALDLVRRLPPDTAHLGLELQLLLGLAVSLGASRGYSVPEVEKALSEARTICDKLGNVADLFWVLRNICNFSITVSDLAAAEETARLCSDIADRTGASEHRIEADAALSYIFTMKGELQEARLHIERAVRLYREVNGAKLTFPTPQDPMVVAMGSYPLVLYALGETAAAEAAVTDALAHARALGRSFDLAYALSWLATYDNIIGNHDRALKRSQEALAICESNRSDTYAIIAKNQISYCLGQTSNAPELRTTLSEGVESMRKIGALSMQSYFLYLLGELEYSSDDPEAAIAAMNSAIDHALRFGERYLLSRIYCRRADMLADLPDSDLTAMTDSLRLALSAAEAQGAKAFAAQARARLATVTG